MLTVNTSDRLFILYGCIGRTQVLTDVWLGYIYCHGHVNAYVVNKSTIVNMF